MRLPPASYEQIQPMLGAVPVALWPLAVEPMGRAFAHSPTHLDAPTDIWNDTNRPGTLWIPVLVHAGPEAGRHSKERPLGPEAIVNVRWGRAPVALNDSGWASVTAQYVHAATHLQKLGAHTQILSLDDDGLLASTISPRTHPSRLLAEKIAIVLDLVRAVKKTGVTLAVALTLEELCPHGLDATDGIRVALALESAGIEALFISGGTRTLEHLRRRDAATILDDPFLSTAAWLVGRTSLPIWAQGPAPDPMRAFSRAKEAGLAGIVAECFTDDS